MYTRTRHRCTLQTTYLGCEVLKTGDAGAIVPGTFVAFAAPV